VQFPRSISEKTILNQILAGKDLAQIASLPAEELMEEPFPQVNEDAPLSLISIFCRFMKPF
jgi:predicted transcriptional regulator